MDATLKDPPTGDPGLGRGGTVFSLRPHRGKWDALLARSTAALDAALRASLSSDRGTAPLTRWQRGRAAGAALAGVGGICGLAALASLRLDLGAYEPAALTGAVAAAGLPAALCIRRAIVGAERRSAETASAAGASEVPPVATAGGLRRLMGGLRWPDRASRRLRRRQDRAVKRALADIARRERHLADSIAATDEPRLGPAAAAPSPPASAIPRPTGWASRPRATHPAPVQGEKETAEAPWTLPREVTEAWADLENRERLHAERVAAARRKASAAHPAPTPSTTKPSAAPRPTAITMRRHKRIEPRSTRTFITLEDGRKLNATVLDVSQSGVAIEGNLPGLWIGSMVTVGSRRAKAVRVLPRGMAFEFSMPLPAEALTADFVL